MTMNMKLRTSSCISDFDLDKYLLAIGERDKQHIKSHLESCPYCQAKYQEMKLEKENFSPFAQDLSIIRKQMRKEEPSFSWFLRLPAWSWGALATACLLLVIWLPSGTENRWIFRKKGHEHPSFFVAVKRKNLVRISRSGEVFRSGDKLRLAYRWNFVKQGYLFVVHREKQVITALYPDQDGATSIRLQKDKQVALPNLLEVEGQGAGREEIWACFSYHPLVFDDVKQSLPPQQSDYKSGASTKKCFSLIRFELKRAIK